VIDLQSIVILGVLGLLALLVVACIVMVARTASQLAAQEIRALALEAEMREFWYEKLAQLDAKQLASSKATQEQIEKNAELFTKISLGLDKMHSDLNILLHERLELLGDKIASSLKEQQEKSGKDFEGLSKTVEDKLHDINEKVENRLKTGFENIDKTFKEIIVGIAKINQAQKTIESLSSEVVSLQGILTDKKTRGIFGEVQLNSILTSIFGERRELYDIQYTLPNATIADAIIKAPDPVGLICIDSKFPLENYRKMLEDKSFTSEFLRDMKKHINDIADKYILKGVTSDMAVLFLPAEAIFAEVNAYHQDLIDYAARRKVLIASPTTLMAILSTVGAAVRDIKTKEQARKIQEELMKLSKNFKLYRERWEKLSQHIDTVHRDVKEITVTTSKISDEFLRIERVEFDEDKPKLLGDA
jgi:DNA recombination protein RmuC